MYKAHLYSVPSTYSSNFSPNIFHHATTFWWSLFITKSRRQPNFLREVEDIVFRRIEYCQNGCFTRLYDQYYEKYLLIKDVDLLDIATRSQFWSTLTYVILPNPTLLFPLKLPQFGDNLYGLDVSPKVSVSPKDKNPAVHVPIVGILV